MSDPTDPTSAPKAKASVLSVRQTLAVYQWLKNPETRAWLDAQQRTRLAIADKCAVAVGCRVTVANIESVATGAKVPLTPPPAPDPDAEFESIVVEALEALSAATNVLMPVRFAALVAKLKDTFPKP